MQLNTLSSKTKRAPSRRVGRGGKRGKTSGRGTKGQKARAGHRMRPEIRDMIKKLPKRRGYHFTNVSVKPAVLNLVDLNVFENGDTVTPATLVGKGLVRKNDGKLPAVKILGTGELSKKLSVSGCSLSGSAREKITNAGGSVADAPAA